MRRTVFRILDSSKKSKSRQHYKEKIHCRTLHHCRTSERMQRVLKQHDVIIAHKVTNTLRSNICQLKDRLDHQDKNNAVYKIPCLDCNVVYVGKTSKCVKDRIKEHKTAVNRKYEQSLIYQHTHQTEHHFYFHKTKVLQQQKSTGPRKILESIYSNLNPSAINRCHQLPQQ